MNIIALNSRGRFFISAILFLFPLFVFSENSISTTAIIESNSNYFNETAIIFDINPAFLKSIVYVERTLNYDWSDKIFDVFFAQSGRNSSIGFCQVKLKTAYWIEKQLNDSTSNFFPGEKYYKKLTISNSSQEIINKLNNDSLNILYAGAYIRIIQSLWKKSGFPINDRVDILATLYSTGLFQSDGSLRKPHKNPKANYFGKKAVNCSLIFTAK